MNVTERYRIRGGSASEIAGSVERAAREGRLRPGERLPTVRALADALDVSPGTVAAAYRRLHARGLAVGAGRRGTRLAGAPALRARAAPAAPAGALDLASGNPDPALLPPLGPALRALDPPPYLYGEPSPVPGLPALAARALAADGVACERVAIVSGALDGILRVLEAQLRPGDRVALEDPGFTSVIDLCTALGLVPLPVALDDEGPRPESLEAALASGAQAFVLTPRAQNPTGAALSARRAQELRALLRSRPSVLVVEDDHAGAVAGAPMHTLCDPRRERWAVVRSLAKSLGPDLRVAFLAADEETLARVEGRQQLDFRWVSYLLQRLALRLLEDAAVRRAVRRAERAYAERREALLRALARRGVDARGRSGLNVWVPVREEAPALSRLLAEGIAVAPGERFRLRSAPGLRVTTARLAPEDAERVADAVARALAPSTGGAPV